MERGYQWLELFAGGGGVATGLKAAGHQVAAAVELEPKIAECYEANHHHKPIIDDVRNVTISNLPGSINAIWASPVCKQDSQARKKNLDAREDAAIGLALIPFIQTIQPELFILENVSGYRCNPVYASIVSCLVRLKYALSERVVDAADYGVPQSRERLILQARRGPIAWPEQTTQCARHTALADLYSTMEQSSLANWQRELWKPEYDALIPVMISGQYAHRGDRKNPKPKALDILPANRPARTVTASHNSTQKRIVLSDGRVLRVSPRENARLQSFPDGYIWPAQSNLASTIIGNAVPPLLVQQLTESYAKKMEAA